MQLRARQRWRTGVSSSIGARAAIGLSVITAAVLLARPTIQASHPAIQDNATSATRAFDVLHYDARIEPDVAAGTIKGSVALTVRRSTGEPLTFDRGSLTIDTVTIGGIPVRFEVPEKRLIVHPAAAASDSQRPVVVSVDYHGAPRNGMRFDAQRESVFTEFSTSEWLVCVMAPDERATLTLELVVPRQLAVTGNGTPTTERALPDGRKLSEWRQITPVPAYIFGFAAGRFTDVSDESSRVRFRFLANGYSATELRAIFRDSADMLQFFADRAGVPYGDASYTQVIAGNGAGQEMAGFTVLPDAYGRIRLQNEQQTSLGAHEMAHQWWGNMVTNHDWTHLWLNESMATFMADAYLEQRYGREAYLAAIAQSRARYDAVRSKGADRSLIFPDWNRPTADDRTLVYHKGTVALHELRIMLGDDLFWRALRDYTQARYGQSVTTADFQASFEKSTGRDLSAFFVAHILSTTSTSTARP